MSNNLDKGSEEIDLLQLFGFFESKIKGVFKLFFRGFKSIFEILISFLKVLQQHFIKLAIVVGIATVVGFAYDMYKPKVYTSKMIVKPLFDSKYQLVTNIKYYNELVVNKEYSKLSAIFSVDENEAKNLSSFDIIDGPESEKEKTRIYNRFMKSLDSVAASTVNYDKFVENITIYDASLYEIKVNSSDKDVFGKISNGFKRTFKSDYSKANKQKKDTLYKLKKKSINKSLEDIDALKKVYIKELSKEKSQEIKVLGNSAFKLADDEQKTREFEMLQLQIEEQKKLTTLEEETIEENQLFEIVSDFQPIGSVEGGLLKKMKLMFPLGAFVIILLIVFGIKFNRFVANYNTDS